MLYIDRLNSIKQMLLQQESVTVAELSEIFDVSSETIRRDLEKLSQEDSRVIRIHGGAFYRSTVKDTPYSYRKTALLDEKIRIAQGAVSCVNSGDCIMMDCSTTTLNLARLLKDSGLKLTIITNSLDILDELSDSENIKLICLGGSYVPSSRAFTGGVTISSLSNFHADSCFISSSGISQEFGITDVHEDMALIRRTMLKNSSRRILLVDHTKFGRCKTNRIDTLSTIDCIYTDSMPGPDWMETFDRNKIELCVS